MKVVLPHVGFPEAGPASPGLSQPARKESCSRVSSSVLLKSLMVTLVIERSNARLERSR